MRKEDVLRLVQSRRIAEEEIEAPLRAAVDEVFAELRAKILRMARARVRDAAHAEDVANETLAIAWRRLPDFRFESTFDAYAWGICRNVLRGASHKTTELLTEDGVIEVGSEMATGPSGLRAEEQERVLQTAIAQLPLEEQAVLHLRYVDGMSVDEVTEELGLQNKTGARPVLVRTRRRLEHLLRDALAQLALGESFFFTSTPL